ncbi:MAG: hypothetical protein QXO93_03000 [Acidilobaceae archaeon]
MVIIDKHDIKMRWCNMRHNLLETLISIPYNIVVAGHKQLGLDAYFWDKLRVLYRRVLLIRNTEALCKAI